jgi:uncharacterized membrane protein
MLATLPSIYKHIDTNQNIFIQRLIEYVRHPSIIAQEFYRKHLGHRMTARTNWPAAIAFYLLFLLGLTILVIIPGLEAGSLSKAILLGTLYGFFTYVTYDLTNLATLRYWPLLAYDSGHHLGDFSGCFGDLVWFLSGGLVDVNHNHFCAPHGSRDLHFSSLNLVDNYLSFC